MMIRNRIATRPPALLALVLLLAVPATAQVTGVEELTYPPLPEFDVPQPTRAVLDNGMVIMLLEDHELPLVDVLARIRTGSRHEPADKIGLASLTGTVLRTGGTLEMSGDEMDDFLEGKAASIETSIGAESGSASMSCLAEDFPEVLELFADVLRRPAFDEQKLEVARNQVNSGIARQNDAPMQIMFREFSEVVYGQDSPYARTPTYTTVASVSRDDLVAWHERYFHPNNVILGLVGDFDTEKALAAVREVFGDWPRGPATPPFTGGIAAEVEPGVYYVRKDDMTQSNIIMGHLGIQRDNPDYLSVELMNEVFAGSFASRLFTRIRTKQGLAYAVSGGVGSSWDHPGSAQLWMTTKTETTGTGIEALLREARNLTAEPPTEDEVRTALAGILNSFVFNSDSRRKILGQQMTYEYYGYPLDWLSRYYEGIQEVGVEAVRAAAEKHLHPDRFAILVVGPGEGRDRPLEDFGTVTTVDITIPELEAERVAATAESRSRGAELVAAAVAALGGGERIDSVASLSQSGSAVATTPQGEMQIGVSELFAFPDRYRQELRLPFGTMVTVITADEGFLVTPQGVRELPDSQRADTRKSMRRELLYLLRLRAQPGFEAIALGGGEIDGRSVERVQVDVMGDLVTLAIDPDNGEVVQMGFRGSGFAGAPGEIVQTYSDYREVGGLRLPFRTTSTFDGAPYIDVTAEEVRVDVAPEGSAFERPPPEPAGG